MPDVARLALRSAWAALIALGLAIAPARAQVDFDQLLGLGIEVLRQMPAQTAPPPPATAPRHQPAPTWAAPEAPRAAGPRVDPGVLLVQRELARLGYDPGPQDGLMGARTRAAITAFQHAHALPPTGRVDQSLIGSLRVAAPPPAVASAAEPPVASSANLGPGLRSPSPARSGDRLLTGFPIVHGPLNEGDVTIGTRHYSKSSFDLALTVDLMLLRAFPELFEDQTIAAEYARRFLEEPLLASHYPGCEYPCDSAAPFAGWRGGNEFERKAAYQAFVAEFGPRLAAAGSEPELGVLNLLEVEILPYDEASGAFPLRPRRPGPGLFGFVEAVADPTLTVVGEVPEALPMAPDAAAAFIARFSGAERFAYLGIRQTLRVAGRDHLLDRPALELVQTEVALYADPLAQELLHGFPAEPAAAPAPPAPPPAAEAREVDPKLLVFRLAPQLVPDEALLNPAMQQIADDQNALSLSGGAPEPTMFSADEVAGRVPQFAAQELLGTYRARLSELVGAMPLRLAFVEDVRLDQLEYRDGLLRRPAQYAGSDRMLLGGQYQVPEQGLSRLPALGAREVLSMPHQVVAVMPEPALPEALVRLTQQQPRQLYLALDRIPVIPPLAIDAATAKSFWQAPTCDISEYTYLQAGMSREAAGKAADVCRAARGSYDGKLKAFFDIEAEDAVASEIGYVVRARLLGARLVSPQGAVVRTYAAEEFEPAADFWGAETAAEAAEEQAAAAETAAATSADAAEEQARATAIEGLRERVARADIAGIRLGMTTAEAEAIIRAEIEVGWVGSLVETDPSQFGTPDPNEPYRDFRVFISAEGDQQFVLFGAPAPTGTVLAVARTIRLPGTLPHDELVAQLVEKYGPTAEETEHAGLLVWTADPGAAPDHEAMGLGAFRFGGCNADVRASYRALRMETGATGRDDLARIKSRVPAINVYGGRSKGPRNDRYYYDPTLWEACGPTVLAQVSSTGEGSELTYAIIDLRAYAPHYVPGAPKEEAISVVPKL